MCIEEEKLMRVNRQLILSLAISLFASAGIFGVIANVKAGSYACLPNDNIISCGVSSAGELKREYDKDKRGVQTIFEHMGILSYNAVQKLHFEPLMTENYSAIHFALPSISLMPIVRQEPKMIKLEKQVPTNIKQQKHIIRRVAAVAIPLSVLGLVAYQWLPLRNTHKVNMSLLPTQSVATATVAKDIVASEAEVYHIDYFCDDKSITLLSEAEESLAEAPHSQEIDVLPQGRFHIISGVFNTQERANRWINTLKAKGFKAYLLPHYQNGRYWVSAANYKTKPEALKQLKIWQLEGTPDWWFYEKSIQ